MLRRETSTEERKDNEPENKIDSYFAIFFHRENEHIDYFMWGRKNEENKVFQRDLTTFAHFSPSIMNSNATDHAGYLVSYYPIPLEEAIDVKLRASINNELFEGELNPQTPFFGFMTFDPLMKKLLKNIGPSIHEGFRANQRDIQSLESSIISYFYAIAMSFEEGKGKKRAEAFYAAMSVLGDWIISSQRKQFDFCTPILDRITLDIENVPLLKKEIEAFFEKQNLAFMRILTAFVGCSSAKDVNHLIDSLNFTVLLSMHHVLEDVRHNERLYLFYKEGILRILERSYGEVEMMRKRESPEGFEGRSHQGGFMAQRERGVLRNKLGKGTGNGLFDLKDFIEKTLSRHFVHLCLYDLTFLSGFQRVDILEDFNKNTTLKLRIFVTLEYVSRIYREHLFAHKEVIWGILVEKEKRRFLDIFFQNIDIKDTQNVRDFLNFLYEMNIPDEDTCMYIEQLLLIIIQDKEESWVPKVVLLYTFRKLFLSSSYVLKSRSFPKLLCGLFISAMKKTKEKEFENYALQYLRKVILKFFPKDFESFRVLYIDYWIEPSTPVNFLVLYEVLDSCLKKYKEETRLVYPLFESIYYRVSLDEDVTKNIMFLDETIRNSEHKTTHLQHAQRLLELFYKKYRLALLETLEIIPTSKVRFEMKRICFSFYLNEMAQGFNVYECLLVLGSSKHEKKEIEMGLGIFDDQFSNKAFSSKKINEIVDQILENKRQWLFYLENNAVSKVIKELRSKVSKGLQESIQGFSLKSLNTFRSIANTNRNAQIRSLLGLHGESLDSTLENLNSMVSSFEEKLKVLQKLFTIFQQYLAKRIHSNFQDILKTYQDVPIVDLKLTPDEIDSIQKKTVIYKEFFDCSIFKFFIQQVLISGTETEISEEGSIVANIEKALSLIQQNILNTAPTMTLEDLLLSNLPRVTNFKTQAQSYTEWFNKKGQKYQLEKISQHFFWIQNKLKLADLKEVCFLFLNTVVFYKRTNPELHQTFEKMSSKIIEIQPNLLVLWKLFENLSNIDFEFMKSFSKAEALVVWLREQIKERFNDAADILKDPTNSMMYGGLFDVNDITTLERLKFFDDQVSGSKVNDAHFLEFFSKEVQKFIVQNQKSFEQVSRFTEKLDQLEFLFKNIGNQAKMVQSTIESILKRENEPSLVIDMKNIERSLHLEIQLECTIKNQNKKLRFKKVEIDNYYQIVQLFHKEEAGSTAKILEKNPLKDTLSFSEVYSGILEIENSIKSLYEAGYDIESLRPVIKESSDIYQKSGSKEKVFGIFKLMEKLSKVAADWEGQYKSISAESEVIAYFSRAEYTDLINAILNIPQEEKKLASAPLKAPSNESLRNQLTTDPLIDNLFKNISPSIKRENLLEIKEKMKKEKEFERRLRILCVGLKSFLLKNIPCENKAHSKDAELRSANLVIWRVPINSFIKALIVSINQLEEYLPLPNRIYVLSKKTPVRSLENFIDRVQLENGVFYVIIPKSEATLSHSTIIESLRASIAKIQGNLTSLQKRLVIISHEELSLKDLFSDERVVSITKFEADLKPFTGAINKFIMENDRFYSGPESNRNLGLEIVESAHSGEGKSFQYNLLAKKKDYKYVELTFGGHTDFNSWIKRIVILLSKAESEKVLFNNVIGVPEGIEKPDELEHFCCQMSLFIFISSFLRGYRSSQGNISYPEELAIKVELSNSPRNILQKHLEIYSLLKVRKIEPFNMRQIEFGNLEEEYRIWEHKFKNSTFKEGKESKIDNVIYAMCKVIMDKVNTRYLQFPAPGAGLMTNEVDRYPAFEQMIKPLLERNVEKLGVITYRNFLITMNTIYHEILDFNSCSGNAHDVIKAILETVQWDKEKLKKMTPMRTQLIKNIIEYSFIYSTTAAANFIKKQEGAMSTNFDDWQEDFNSRSSIIRFEDMKWVLTFFGPTQMKLLFKNLDDVSYDLKKTHILQEYFRLKKLEKDKVMMPVDKVMKDKIEEALKKEPIDFASFPEYFTPLSDDPAMLWDLLAQMCRCDVSLLQGDSNFVLTADGLIKAVIMSRKIRASIPLILIGETGTGKTFLTQFLGSKVWPQILRDDYPGSVDYKYVLVHAGFGENELIEMVKKNSDIANENPKRLTIVFLDEFNTCNSVDLVSNLICKRELFGRKLIKNLVFIGACNPFNLKSKEQLVMEADQAESELNALVKPKGGSKLVYTVNHLTECELSYLFDFGSITEAQEQSFARIIIEKLFQEHPKANKWAAFVCELLSFCQAFSRQLEGQSSMSLRDIKKLVKLLNWYWKTYFPLRLPLEEHAMTSLQRHSSGPRENPEEEEIKKAIICSFGMCYYFRITTSKKREEFDRKITELIKSKDVSYGKNFKFSDYIFNETRFLVENMEVEQGISKNSALSENVFALFSCFNTNIPILLCGKPGCSKSLAIQILTNNMKGEMSKTRFMENFPQLQTVYFQGSQSSKSEGIDAAFTNAFNISKNLQEGNATGAVNAVATSRNFLVVLIIDELGLAEISPYNPLKVLHGYLDDDRRPCGFAGISNWGLDAAKNNRAVFVARPSLDIKDLAATAEDISGTYNVDFPVIFKELWLILAKAYWNFIQDQVKTEKKMFHGPRDYYSVVKSICSQLEEEKITSMDGEALRNILQIKISRNFGGIGSSGAKFINHLNVFMAVPIPNTEPPIYELLKDHLKDKNSRYLMIISRGGGRYALKTILGQVIKNYSELVLDHDTPYKTLVGLPEHMSPEEKERKITEDLNDFQQYMLEGRKVILDNYRELYTSLYDLFNMRVKWVGTKKYCEIAHSTKQNRFAEIHENFKVLVLVDQDNLDKEEAPFLNRFEKYILNYENAMNSEQNKISKKLTEFLDSLYVDGSFLHFSRVFFGCNKEMINSTIIAQYLKRSKDKKTSTQLYDEVLKKIARLLPLDAYVHMQIQAENGSLPLDLHEKMKQSHRYYSKKYPEISSIVEYLLRSKTTTKMVCFSFSGLGHALSELKEKYKKTGKIVVLNSNSKLIPPKTREERKNTAFVVDVEEEKELRSLNRMIQVADEHGLYLLVLVKLKRSKEAFDQSLLKEFHEINGWKSIYIDLESKIAASDVLNLMTDRSDVAKIFGILSNKEDVLIKSLIRSLMKAGIKLSRFDEATYDLKIQRFRNILSSLFSEKRLAEIIFTEIYSNSAAIGSCWRKTFLMSEEANVYADSFWDVIRVLLNKTISAPSIVQMVRMLIHFGVPQSMATLIERKSLKVYSRLISITEGRIRETVPNNTNILLQYEFNLGFYMQDIEPEYSRLVKLNTKSDDLARLIKGTLDLNKLINREKLKDVQKVFESIYKLPEKDEIIPLVMEDIYLFFFFKNSGVFGEDNKSIVAELEKKEKNPFSGIENDPLSTRFLLFLFSADLIGFFILFKKTLQIKNNFVIFSSEEAFESVCSALVQCQSSEEMSRISISYERLREYMKIIMEKTSFLQWQILDCFILFMKSVPNETLKELKSTITHYINSLVKFQKEKLEKNSHELAIGICDIVFSAKASPMITYVQRSIIKRILYLATANKALANHNSLIQSKVISLIFQVQANSLYFVSTIFDIIMTEPRILETVLENSDLALPDFFTTIEAALAGSKQARYIFRAVLEKFIRHQANKSKAANLSENMGLMKYVFERATKRQEFWKTTMEVELAILGAKEKKISTKYMFAIREIFMMHIKMHISALCVLMSLYKNGGHFEGTNENIKEWMCFFSFVQSDPKFGQFHKFLERLFIRQVMRAGLSFSNMVEMMQENKIVLKYVQFPLRSPFPYEYHPSNTKYNATKLHISQSLAGQDFRLDLPKNLRENKEMSYFCYVQSLLNTIYLQNITNLKEQAMYIERLTDCFKKSENEFPEYIYRLAINCIQNMPNFPAFELTKSSSAEQVNRNLLLVTIFNAIISTNKGISEVYMKSPGIIRDPSEMENLFIPGTVNERITNYLDLLNLNLQYRNYNQTYTNSTHLLLECKDCGSLYAMFACNAPHEGKRCNPPQCTKVIDANYVTNNHVDNPLVELPNRVSKELEKVKGLELLGVIGYQKDSMIGNHHIRMFTYKVLNLIQLTFFLFVSQFDKGYRDLVFKHFDLKSDKKEDILAHLIGGVDSMLKQISQDLGSSYAPNKYLWLVGLFFDIFEMSMTYTEQVTNSFAGRAKFESKLNDKIISNLTTINAKIENYKTIYRNQDLGKEMLEILEEMKEDRDSDFYQTLRQSLEFSAMNHGQVNAMILAPGSQAYLTKSIYSKEEEVSKITRLFSLIKYYNFTLHEFAGKVTEKDAVNKKIKEFIQDPKFSQLMGNYQKLEAAWNFPRPFKGAMYDCKAPKDIVLSDSLPLEFILPSTLPKRKEKEEDKLNGMQIVAVMQTLSHLQNEIINDAVDKYPQRARELLADNFELNLPFEDVNERHIIKLSRTLNELVQYHVNYSISTSPDSIILVEECDPRSLEEDLISELLRGKRKICESNLDFKGYVFSGQSTQEDMYMSSVSDKISQQLINPSSSKVIREKVQRMIHDKRKEELDMLFGDLEDLLYHIRDTSVVEDCSISSFVQRKRYSGVYDFLAFESKPWITSLKMSNFKRLFEEIEAGRLRYRIENKIDHDAYENYEEEINEGDKQKVFYAIEAAERGYPDFKWALMLALSVYINRFILKSVDRDTALASGTLNVSVPYIFDEEEGNAIENFFMDPQLPKVTDGQVISLFKLLCSELN